jgi:type VI secretion system protein VasG
MTEISRVALFGKLNKLGYQAVESATVFCKMRGNPYVEVVHWMHQILNGQDSDLHRIAQHYDLDPGKIASEMTRALDMLPRGASTISDLSDHLMDAMERGWVWGSLLYSSNHVRTGHLLLGMLKTPALRNILTGISPELASIGADDLADNFNAATDGSPEERLVAQDGSQTGGGAAPGEASDAIAPAQMGKEEALEQFCTDMTEQARNGEIDPIVGRDEEIRQIVDVLMRRRQNNPILTGEAGVGKTAVVEGFALRIARGDVPPAMQDVRLLMLDVGLLQAGASMKGEFENRLRMVIDEVQASPVPIILFIDETHTLIGAFRWCRSTNRTFKRPS